MHWPKPAATVQSFKTARNRVVHGYISHLKISELEMSFVGAIVFLQMLKAIGGSQISARIEDFVEDATPLVRELLNRKLPHRSVTGATGQRFHSIAKSVWGLRG
jgi:hypothetical protein